MALKRLRLMIFWSIAIAVTAIVCAALFYAAARRTVNATGPEMPDANSHFRLLLAGIASDVASGKLDADQARAAKGELAREMLRAEGEGRDRQGELGRTPILVGLGAIAALSFGLYSVLGSPDLPAQPLADRPEVLAQNISLEDAIGQIEARLAAAPDDLRGWTVIAPAYVELERYADAANAYRQAIALSAPDADLETNLAETLLLAANGAGSDEAMSLLRSAAEIDPDHVRSRLYLAAELMRSERYDEAATLWQETIALSQGDEAWLPAARQGLAVAEADGVDNSAQQQADMIAGMVGSLSTRLYDQGGSVEEWSQLVRSYLVLGDQENAQRAYDAAIAAYPAAFDRGELDTIALDAGLTLDGGIR